MGAATWNEAWSTLAEYFGGIDPRRPVRRQPAREGTHGNERYHCADQRGRVARLKTRRHDSRLRE